MPYRFSAGAIALRKLFRSAETPARRRVLAMCMLACILLLGAHAPTALAVMRKVDAGDHPALGEGEALLLIAIDSDVDIASLRISREGANADVVRMTDLGAGRNSKLYVVPAGRYRWDMLTTSNLRYKLGKHEEFGFRVKPGMLNYPGDLIYRNLTRSSGITHVSNRGLAAMDWLEKRHPALFRDVRFEFIGHYPDPFPEIYREAVAKGRTEAVRPSPPDSGELPIPIDLLWKPAQLQLIELSPAGDLAAEVLLIKKPGTKRQNAKNGAGAGDENPELGAWIWALNLIDLRKREALRLYESEREIWRIDWLDRRTLAMSIGPEWKPSAVVAINIVDGAKGRSYDKVIVPRTGMIVRALPNEPGHVLFLSRGSGDRVMVHRLDMRSEAAMERMGFDTSDRLNKSVEEADWWLADAAGRLRAAFLTRKDGDRVMLHGQDKDFREVLNFGDDESHFRPLALSADGERIYGLSDEGRDQRDLVEFDPATRRIVKTLFSKRGIDTEGIRVDDAGGLIGASFYQDGLLVSEYFDHDSDVADRSLRAAFPGKAVSLMQRSLDGQQMIAAVSGSDRPTEIYHYDRTNHQAALISETTPWLADRVFAEAHTLKARSKDGFEIEAYLTLPNNASRGKHPLVVFPHGGPIGVRDDRFFDPDVQFMAALGYAVLQVNFRGSEGFGTAFRKAGEGGYGTAIEDDVDAAIAAALAAYPLNESRMCAVGGSYGGYSAMVSSIRWPQRYRCVISMSGVSDRALFFTASDAGRSKEMRAEMEKLIGNPNTDMQAMMANSPLYRYRDMTTPLLLIHGTEDLRVDYEHTRRIVRMLDLAGRPPTLVELQGEGHGFDDIAQRRKAWSAVAGFLRRYLGDPLAQTRVR